MTYYPFLKMSSPDLTPKISVCAPYWKRPQALQEMFTTYQHLYPKLDIEFSICDDGSPVSDSAFDVPLPPHSQVIRLQPKDVPLNPCVPINEAVNRSHCEIVVLTTPEIEHREPVLQEMLMLLGDDEDNYVTARCWDERGIWVAGPEVNYNTHGRLPVPPGAHFHFCAMFRRSLWEKAGGFDEEYRHGQACDDNDWLWRLWSVGAKFRVAQGVVYHTKSDIKWNLPHNRHLFMRKWPQAMGAT